MPSFDAAARLALELPGVERSTSYGTPALKLRDRLIARLKEDGETLVLRCDPGEREALSSVQPEAYFLTAHYEDHPYVLVRLGAVDPGELEELLEEA